MRCPFASAEHCAESSDNPKHVFISLFQGHVNEGAGYMKCEKSEQPENKRDRSTSSQDRTRFVDSWAKVQARFVDSPGGAVTDADQLLGDVMSTRGYPVGDFEQRAADISVDHPRVLENYRAAHKSALLQTQGKASTEDLRQAMIFVGLRVQSFE